MGIIESFPHAKLIMGIIFSPMFQLKDIVSRLESVFGPPDYQSDVLDFNYTDYYTTEMGEDLSRCFLSFKELICPSRLAECKLKSDRIEQHFTSKGSRMVNLDPGMLTLHSLILASTKNHSHRIPLSSGIYAEVTLIYSGGNFQDLHWTYPDYRTEEYKSILLEIRNNYRVQLKQNAKSGHNYNM